MKRILIMSMCGMLGACAVPQSYRDAGFSDAQSRRDMSQCKDYVGMNPMIAYVPVVGMLAALSQEADKDFEARVDACMQARGYPSVGSVK